MKQNAWSFFFLPILSILSLFLCFSYCELCDECRKYAFWLVPAWFYQVCGVSFHDWSHVVSLRCGHTAPIGWVSIRKPGLSCLPLWKCTCYRVDGVNRCVLKRALGPLFVAFLSSVFKHHYINVNILFFLFHFLYVCFCKRWSIHDIYEKRILEVLKRFR